MIEDGVFYSGKLEDFKELGNEKKIGRPKLCFRQAVLLFIQNGVNFQT